MVSTRELLLRLHDQKVDHVIVGEMAAVIHGSTVVTEDLDICAPLTLDNLTRIVTALAGLNARHRMTRRRLPLLQDPSVLQGFKNLYLETDIGQLDILSEIDGVGDYAAVASHAITLDVFGLPVHVLDLDTLILAKARIGRSKDRRVVADLEMVRQRLKQPPAS